MIQYITLAEVKAAAKRAYDENRLLAQRPSDETLDYGYRVRSGDKVYCCAIGAGLTDDTLDAMDKEVGIGQSTLAHCHEYLRREYFSYNMAEHLALVSIQQAHDHWAGPANHPSGEGEFLKLIGAPP